MKANLIMFTSKTLIDLCIIKQSIKYNFCINYLQCFSTKEILANHQKVCLEINEKQATEILEKGGNIKFIGHRKQLKGLFEICADFGSVMKKSQKINRNNPNESCTNKYQEHFGCSYRYKVVCI